MVFKGPTSKGIIKISYDNTDMDMQTTINGNEFTFSDVLNGVGFIGKGYIVDNDYYN